MSIRNAFLTESLAHPTENNRYIEHQERGLWVHRIGSTALPQMCATYSCAVLQSTCMHCLHFMLSQQVNAVGDYSSMSGQAI